MVVEPKEQESISGLAGDIRTLLAEAWRLDPRRLVVQVILLAIGGLVGGIGLLLLVPIVNSVANPASTITVPLLGAMSLGSIPLSALLVAFVLLTLVQALVTRTSMINSTRMQQEIVDRLRGEAFDAILSATWTFILKRRRSDVIEIVTTGAARSGLAFQQLLQGAVTFVLALATAFVALLISPAVVGIALVGVVMVGALRLMSIRPSYRLGVMFGDRNRTLQSVMADSMDSLRLIRAHDASPVWTVRLTNAFTDARDVQIATARRSSTVTAISSVALASAAAMLVLLSVQMNVPATSIVVILLLVARLTTQVQMLANTANLLANFLPSVGDLTSLASEARAAAEVPAGEETTRSPMVSDSHEPLLDFRDVTFTYPDSDSGIESVTFTVPRGEITALSGHSGAGKSTTADLALGLLTPRSGVLLIDGVPLVPGDLRWWRGHVAYVPQETVLLPGTLRDNLVWSSADPVTDDECWTALDRSAARFARSLPHGLDTVLGDRGARLSGGERQRVAIARALLRRPSLLVLDEATSSLDSEMESAVLELITGLVPAVTVLVIAHRQSTLDAAHHVVRLEHGRVVAA